jgi:hypothetical protein
MAWVIGFVGVSVLLSLPNLWYFGGAIILASAVIFWDDDCDRKLKDKFPSLRLR